MTPPPVCPPARWTRSSARWARSWASARPGPGLQSTVSAWWLDIDSELLFVGDAGSTEASRSSRFYGLRLRYFAPRSLIEDNTVRSTASALVNLQAGYAFNPKWKLTVDVFNLLNRKASDIEYYYESRLRGEAINPDPVLNGGYNDIHLHPAEPISFRVALSGRF